MVVKLYIGDDRLDLFPDENINVTSSITNSSDITKNTTDYSKDFTVPATNINNQVFKHYYNANIDNTFDARVKADGRIELDGVPYKTGKWRLEKVNVKSGRPSSYTIVFFGNLVSLVDLLGNDELSDLNLSDLDHEYNSDNVRDGLTLNLFAGDIVYNLLPKKRYIYDSDVTNTTQTNALANIAVTGTSNGVVWNDLRPSIKMIKIIEAIEGKYAFNFSSDFFNSDEFSNLYLWLNNEGSNKQIQSSQQINFSSITGTVTDFNLTTDVWTPTSYFVSPSNRRTLSATLFITPSVGFENVPYTIVVKNFGNDFLRVDRTGTANSGQILLNSASTINYSLTFHIETSMGFNFTADLDVTEFLDFGIISGNVIAGVNSFPSTFEINKNMPKIKVIDFLGALFKMYKLVVFQEGNEIYVNTLNQYYSEGNLIDITRYVDFENVEVARGNILKEITFEFAEPTTILNTQFEINTGLGYGDEFLQLVDDTGKPLDGDDLEYKIPFEQLVFERLIDIDTNEVTPIMYGSIINESLEPANPKVVIFYNEAVDLSTHPISFINDLGVQEVLDLEINTASHIYPLENQLYSTVFGAEFSNWNGIIINNTLYTRHHKAYIESIFNIKRRSFAFTAHLPLQILSALKLNDVLRIQGNYYRIDNFTLNLTNGISKLNLINSFDNTITP